MLVKSLLLRIRENQLQMLTNSTNVFSETLRLLIFQSKTIKTNNNPSRSSGEYKSQMNGMEWIQQSNNKLNAQNNGTILSISTSSLLSGSDNDETTTLGAAGQQWVAK